jgi:hypothetical protein
MRLWYYKLSDHAVVLRVRAVMRVLCGTAAMTAGATYKQLQLWR